MPKERQFSRKEAANAAKFVKANVQGLHKGLLCGSYRRKCETVADLDIVVIPNDLVLFHASVSRIADKVLFSGDKKLSFMTPAKYGIQVDFLITDEFSYEAALLHFTGSKLFNIKCRARAKAKGLKLNEYSLWKGSKAVCHTEQGILESIGMEQFLEPRTRDM